MRQVLSAWFNRYFSDPQAVFLAFAFVFVILMFYYMGEMLMPVLISIAIAYLLDGLVSVLEKYRVPRLLAVAIVFTMFIAALFLLLVGILPLLSVQVTQFLAETPKMLDDLRATILELPKKYPEYFTADKIRKFLLDIQSDMESRSATLASDILSISLASIQSMVTILIYIILVPILVFFFLKDKQRIIGFFLSLVPTERGLASEIWRDVDAQIGNYIRGKFTEILIVGVATYIGFRVFDLRYAALLAALVGVSVLVPYIGMIVVTVPVVLVAYFQFGWTSEFYWLIGIYLILQALDGNVLVPVLFSEVVNLHPVAIIIAILVFGGLWGFWGVFFAIPLATVVNAIMKAWPRTGNIPQNI